MTSKFFMKGAGYYLAAAYYLPLLAFLLLSIISALY